MTKPLKVFTKEEMTAIAEQVAEKAAEKTVHHLFSKLDINMDNFDDVRAFRDNQRFLAAQRQGQEQWKRSVQENKILIMGSAAVGTLWLFWDIIKAGISVLFFQS